MNSTLCAVAALGALAGSAKAAVLIDPARTFEIVDAPGSIEVAISNLEGLQTPGHAAQSVITGWGSGLVNGRALAVEFDTGNFDTGNFDTGNFDTGNMGWSVEASIPLDAADELEAVCLTTALTPYAGRNAPLSGRNGFYAASIMDLLSANQDMSIGSGMLSLELSGNLQGVVEEVDVAWLADWRNSVRVNLVNARRRD